MTKKELPKCPKWLIDANTENENVTLNSRGCLQWHSGDFRGGNFRGGNFRGGDFRGGDFRGGKVKGLTAKIICNLTTCEGYSKALVNVDGAAWIMAGCRWFTLADAARHWKGRQDRIQTRAMLHGAFALAKYLGLSAGGAA